MLKLKLLHVSARIKDPAGRNESLLQLINHS